MKMLRRYLALLLGMLLLLSACGEAAVSSPMKETEVFFGTGETEKTEDPVLQASGYKTIFADLDRLGRIKSVIPAGDGYDVYYMTGSSAKIAHLDHDLEMQETRDAPLPNITAAFLHNDDIYYLADAEENGKTVYGVYRGTELLYTLPTFAYAKKCQMVVTDDALYTCTEVGIEMKISANASSIKLAEPEDPIVRRYIGGLVSIGAKPYAVVWQFSEPEMEVMEDYRTYFVPLSSDMKEIRPTGDYFAGAITDGMCASGKENAYGIEGTDFYRVTPEGREILFNLSVLGISRNGILDITEGADGEFLFLMQTGLIVVRKRTAEDMKTAPTEIAIGVIWESEIYSTSSMEYVISQFNLTHDDVKVQLRRFRSVENMNLAILSGELDAIVDLSGGIDEFTNYAEKGYLLSLEELIPDLFQEGVLLPNLIEAYRLHGACYFLPRTVSVIGLNMSKRLMGERTGFESMDELTDYLNTLDEGYLKACYREMFFQYMICEGMDSWVDWDTRKADFMTSSFIPTLELCGKTTRDFQQSAMYSKKYPGGISEFNHGGIASLMLQEGGDPEEGVEQYVAFPVPSEKYDGMAFWGMDAMAAVSTGKHHEAAAEFLDFVYNMKWPKDIDCTGGRYSEAAMGLNLPIKMEEVRTFYCLDDPRNRALGQIYYDMLTTADHVYRCGTLFEIIKEEADGYFFGQITSKQAAEHIQSRIQLYLDERS